MTTQVFNPRTQDSGQLVRLMNGEPVVTWFGDKTEYPTSWRQIVVVSSTDYILPKGKFETELWVDGNGDCWRRRVIESAWPCEPGMTHTSRDDATLCWNCGEEAGVWASVEIFVLVSAEGFPADCPARPASREDVEAFAGTLLLVGSPEARARAHTLSTPTPGGGCPMALAFWVLIGLVVVLGAIQLFRLL